MHYKFGEVKNVNSSAMLWLSCTLQRSLLFVLGTIVFCIIQGEANMTLGILVHIAIYYL